MAKYFTYCCIKFIGKLVNIKLKLRRKRKKNLLLLLHLLYLTAIFRFRKEYLESLFVLHFIVKFGRLFYIFLYQISFQIVWQSRVTSHEQLRVAEFSCELIRLKIYENSHKKVFRDLTRFVTESQIIANIAKISQTIFFFHWRMLLMIIVSPEWIWQETNYFRQLRRCAFEENRRVHQPLKWLQNW